MKSHPVLTTTYAILLVALFVPVFSAHAAREVTTFEVPDVNDDFCGPKMQMAFCRCAFEGEACDVLKMEQGQVRDFVEREYKEWVGERIATVANECLAKDGYWNTATRQCITCTEGEVRDGKECLPPGSTPSGNTTKQCALAAQFAKDWQSLSDFSKTEGEVSESVKSYRAKFDEMLFSVRNAAQYQQQLAVETTLLDQLRRYRTALGAGVALDRDTAFSELVMTKNSLPPDMMGRYSIDVLFDTEGFSEAVVSSFTVATTSEATTPMLVVPTKETIAASLPFGTAYERITATIAGFASEATNAITTTLQNLSLLPFAESDGVFMQTAHYEEGLVDAVYASTVAVRAQTRRALLAETSYLGSLYNDTERYRSEEYQRVAQSVQAACQ